MNIHEYQAKQLFQQYGIAVPKGEIASTGEQAQQVAQSLDSDAWVVKAQVHAGGRGKVGGVKVVTELNDVAGIASEMLGKRLITKQTVAEGLPIELVLVEETSAIDHEFYLSLLVDRATSGLCFVASASGGMDIEEVAESSPEKIINITVNPLSGLQSYQCRQVAFALGLRGQQIKALEKIMRALLALFVEKDASQIEVNPLITTKTGELMALDAKINFDDNALAMHSDIAAMQDKNQEDEKENLAQQFELNYITLNGTIGCMVNGAGLAMATMDLVQLSGGQPANFLDVGGGATKERVAEAFKLILSDTQVKAVLVNIFGGIVQCNIIAEGIIAAAAEIGVTIPVIVRLEGTNAPEGRALLNESTLNITAAENLQSAAEMAVALAEAA